MPRNGIVGVCVLTSYSRYDLPISEDAQEDLRLFFKPPFWPMESVGFNSNLSFSSSSSPT